MDNVTRALICGAPAHITLIDVTKTVSSAAQIHCLSEESLKALGGLLACGAYLASFLKTESGAISITVHPQGAGGSASVSVDSFLHLRGYIDGECAKNLSGADFTVIRDDGFSRPFYGSCSLDSADPSAMLQSYFTISEQIPTFSHILVEVSGKTCSFAGGAVVQAMPGATEDDLRSFKKIIENIAAVGVKKVCTEGADGDYFKTLTCGEEVTKAYLGYKCNCSRQKISGVLAAVGEKELLDICREQGEVRVHCHYCNTDYIFTKESIRGLLNGKN